MAGFHPPTPALRSDMPEDPPKPYDRGSPGERPLFNTLLVVVMIVAESSGGGPLEHASLRPPDVGAGGAQLTAARRTSSAWRPGRVDRGPVPGLGDGVPVVAGRLEPGPPRLQHLVEGLLGGGARS